MSTLGPESTGPLDAARARELLNEAGRLGSASRSGASWPAIGTMLGLGATSSMFMVALHLVTLSDEGLVWLPLVVMGVWLAILIGTMTVFTRATKAGFGRRWTQGMLAWSVVWVLSIVGGTVWWPGQLWFTLASIAALTVVTAATAWNEARR